MDFERACYLAMYISSKDKALTAQFDDGTRLGVSEGDDAYASAMDATRG